MKKVTLFVFMALLLAVSFQRCNQDDVSSEVEKIQFAISVSSGESAGRVNVALPDNASVLLSIESGSGEPVLTQHPVKIFKFGDSYVTEPVELVPGHYRITDFWVVDESDGIMYATPKKGSPLAGIVANPLPRNLHISKNNVTNVDIQVLDVNHYPPEDFGYVSFDIEAGTYFRMGVFANVDDETVMTTADAYIVDGTDTLHHYAIKAKVNNLFFTGDEYKTYTVVVVKPGYDVYTASFKFSELVNVHLKVYLVEEGSQQKVFRLWYHPTTVPWEPQLARFSMILEADEEADLTLDFGNGVVRDLHIEAGGHVETGLVMETGSYLMRLTGDIEKITGFQPYWEGLMEKVDFSALPNLREITSDPVSDFGIPTWDLRYNYKLERADLSGLFVDTVLLPIDHAIRSLDISRSPKLSGEEIDAIIDNLYANTVSHNTTGGGFGNRTRDGEMQGPVSETSLAKLRALRDIYGWGIAPDPE